MAPRDNAQVAEHNQTQKRLARAALDAIMDQAERMGLLGHGAVAVRLVYANGRWGKAPRKILEMEE